MENISLSDSKGKDSEWSWRLFHAARALWGPCSWWESHPLHFFWKGICPLPGAFAAADSASYPAWKIPLPRRSNLVSHMENLIPQQIQCYPSISTPWKILLPSISSVSIPHGKSHSPMYLACYLTWKIQFPSRFSISIPHGKSHSPADPTSYPAWKILLSSRSTVIHPSTHPSIHPSPMENPSPQQIRCYPSFMENPSLQQIECFHPPWKILLLSSSLGIFWAPCPFPAPQTLPPLSKSQGSPTIQHSWVYF